MNSSKLILLLTMILTIGISACKKDLLGDLPEAQNPMDQIQAFETIDIPSGPGKTILGAKLDNPYAKENIEAALLAIDGISYNLTPTHYYIRIRPDHPSQVALLDSFDLDWEEQPLDYEITYQGEYYTDDEIGEGEMPWFYTTIPANLSLPATIPFEVLETMVITPYHTHLTYKAFELSGNADRFEGFMAGDCHPDCIN